MKLSTLRVRVRVNLAARWIKYTAKHQALSRLTSLSFFCLNFICSSHTWERSTAKFMRLGGTVTLYTNSHTQSSLLFRILFIYTFIYFLFRSYIVFVIWVRLRGFHSWGAGGKFNSIHLLFLFHWHKMEFTIKFALQILQQTHFSFIYTTISFLLLLRSSICRKCICNSSNTVREKFTKCGKLSNLITRCCWSACRMSRDASLRRLWDLSRGK